MNHTQEAFIPARYILQALSSGFLDNQGNNALNAFLKGCGLRLDDLDKSNVRVPVQSITRLIPRDSNIPPALLALRFGDQVRLTSQGDLSIVLMTSPTIRDTLGVIRYLCLHSNAVDLKFTESTSHGFLFVDANTGCDFIDAIIITYAFSAIHRLMATISNKRPPISMQVSHNEPLGFKAEPLAKMCSWTFDQPISYITIEKSFLDCESIYADPIEHAAAVKICETELAKKQQSNDLGFIVKRLIEDEKIWNQERVAQRLHISRSTLKRRLAQEGIVFTELLNEIRKRKSLQLLSTSDENLDTIANHLGYSDQSNFSHAFKKWFGVPPGEHVKRHTTHRNNQA